MRQKVMIAFLAVLSVAAVWLLGRQMRDLMRESVREVLAQEGTALARYVLEEDAVNFRRQRNRIAAAEAAAMVNQLMPNAHSCTDRYALLTYSLQQVDPKLQGYYCEFGVYKGDSINFIAAQVDHPVHGFDSFEGLPETWRPNIVEKGTFVLSALPEVRPNVKLHKGWFDKALPVWLKEHPGPIAFMHLDADLYSSTKTVFDLTADRIVPGTIIQFDEFFNYPGWQEHEYRAFTEFVKERHVKFDYLGYSTDGLVPFQVAVVVRGIGDRKTAAR